MTSEPQPVHPRLTCHPGLAFFTLFGLFGLITILSEGTAARPGWFALLALALTWDTHAVVVLRRRPRPSDRTHIMRVFLLAWLGTAAAVWGFVLAARVFAEYGPTLGIDPATLNNLHSPKQQVGGLLFLLFPSVACLIMGASAWLGFGLVRDAWAVLTVLNRVEPARTESSPAA